MSNVEYEYKKILKKEEYDILLSKLNEIAECFEFVQINYYYDNDKFLLFNTGNTVRVRQQLDKLSLQIKQNKHYSSNGQRRCDESSNTIQTLPKQITMNDNEFYYMGSLTTLRKNYYIDNNIISLDISYYLGEVDYELEIESQQRVELPQFITELVNFNSYSNGKYTRFVNKLKTMRQ